MCKNGHTDKNTSGVDFVANTEIYRIQVHTKSVSVQVYTKPVYYAGVHKNQFAVHVCRRVAQGKTIQY